MKTFKSGAKSSEAKPRYDLIVEGARRGAQRMAEGVASHGERNYENGWNDPVFIKDRENHLIEHALLYAQGDRSTDHLGAIIANASMLARLEAIRESIPDATGDSTPVEDVMTVPAAPHPDVYSISLSRSSHPPIVPDKWGHV